MLQRLDATPLRQIQNERSSDSEVQPVSNVPTYRFANSITSDTPTAARCGTDLHSNPLYQTDGPKSFAHEPPLKSLFQQAAELMQIASGELAKSDVDVLFSLDSSARKYAINNPKGRMQLARVGGLEFVNQLGEVSSDRLRTMLKMFQGKYAGVDPTLAPLKYPVFAAIVQECRYRGEDPGQLATRYAKVRGRQIKSNVNTAGKELNLAVKAGARNAAGLESIVVAASKCAKVLESHDYHCCVIRADNANTTLRSHTTDMRDYVAGTLRNALKQLPTEVTDNINMSSLARLSETLYRLEGHQKAPPACLTRARDRLAQELAAEVEAVGLEKVDPQGSPDHVMSRIAGIRTKYEDLHQIGWMMGRTERELELAKYGFNKLLSTAYESAGLSPYPDTFESETVADPCEVLVQLMEQLQPSISSNWDNDVNRFLKEISSAIDKIDEIEISLVSEGDTANAENLASYRKDLLKEFNNALGKFPSLNRSPEDVLGLASTWQRLASRGETVPKWFLRAERDLKQRLDGELEGGPNKDLATWTFQIDNLRRALSGVERARNRSEHTVHMGDVLVHAAVQQKTRHANMKAPALREPYIDTAVS